MPSGLPTTDISRSRPAAGIWDLVSSALPAVIGSACCWTFLFFAIRPHDQNFPLNDDWAFGQGAVEFAAGHGIHYYGWASIPLLGQWLWSAPFIWIGGPSFVALRLSTIVLSWIGLVAFAALLRQSGSAWWQAAALTGALAANPYFVLLQGTFLTDVPALAFALLALAAYQRALTYSDRWLIAAAVLAILGAITRQSAVTACLAMLPAAFRPPAGRSPTRWRVAILLPIAVAIAAHLWMRTRSDIGPSLPALPPPQVAFLLPYLILHTCGLTIFPIVPLIQRTLSILGFTIALCVMVTGAVYWWEFGSQLDYGGLFPYRLNLLSPHGAFWGPPGQPLVWGERPLLLGGASRLLLTAVGCVGGAVLLGRYFGRSTAELSGPLGRFTAWQLPLIIAAPKIHDRYLLPLFPGALRLALAGSLAPSRARLLFSVIFLLALAAFSTCLMHDWLSWNAARWHLGNAAVRSGIAARDIEGGFEWDGRHTRLGKDSKPPPRQPLTLPSDVHNWFPEITGKYALSFSPLHGTRIMARETYSLWLFPGRHEFFLLEATPKAALQTPGGRP